MKKYFINELTFSCDRDKVKISKDLHIVLDGEEKICCNDEAAMNAETEYDATDNFVHFGGNVNVGFEMDRTVFLVTFSGEVHKSKVILQPSGHARKAVVKIRM